MKKTGVIQQVERRQVGFIVSKATHAALEAYAQQAGFISIGEAARRIVTDFLAKEKEAEEAREAFTRQMGCTSYADAVRRILADVLGEKKNVEGDGTP